MSEHETQHDEQAPEPEDAKPHRGVTRRQALAGGAAGVAVLAAGGYGRFALGDEFEEHVAGVLGLDVVSATELLKGARERLGDNEYRIRAAQFLAVTTFPGEQTAPHGARNKGFGELVAFMSQGTFENLVMLGMARGDASRACAGLLKSAT
jgi:hypothetical protein